jgi:DNA polymerase-3 subunit beta
MAESNTLILRATNLDLGVEVRVPGKVEEQGAVVVPGGVFSGVLSAIHDPKVSLNLKGENLSVVALGMRSVIKCMPHEDFPTLPVVVDGDSFELSAEKFVDGVKSVWYSASLSDMKPEIASVYIYPDGEDLVFTATDSFRLAEKKVALKKRLSFSHLLIPHKNISEILRVLEGTSEEINVHFTKNQISFSFPGVYITSRIIDGNFPDYRQIIPKSYTAEAVLLKQDLLNALKVTNLFTDKFNRVDLIVDGNKKKFLVESKNAAVGENSAEIDARITGKEIHCGFNQKYILDCFQSLKHESVVLKFSGEGRPLVIQSMNDLSFMYLVMPLTV